MKNLIILFFGAILFSSCTTTLKVTVDIFDRAAFRNSNEYKLLGSDSTKNKSCIVFEQHRFRFKEDAKTIFKAATSSNEYKAFMSMMNSGNGKDSFQKKIINDTTTELMSNSFADNIVCQVKCEACIE